MRKEFFIVTQRPESHGGGEVLARGTVPMEEILFYYEDTDGDGNLTRTCIVLHNTYEIIIDTEYDKFKKQYNEYLDYVK